MKNDKLKRWLELNKPQARSDNDNITRPMDQPIPLSFGQLRLWFLQQINPGNPFYHYAECYRINGPLQKERLFQSFRELVTRHDILRTTFPNQNGTPIQLINSQLEAEMNYHDLRSIDPGLKTEQAHILGIEDAKKQFNLDTGPLVRLKLIRLEDQEYQMVITMHHIITDKWSMNIIREEWSRLYRGETLEASEIQYADFAYQQRHQKVDNQHLEYWVERLAGELPVLELPLGRIRNRNPSYAGAYCERKFTPEQSQGLRTLCQKQGTTMFVLMLSVFKVLLYRYTGISDLLVATPVTNRDQTRYQKLIGFFNETLVLRDHITGQMSFLEVVSQIQTTVFEAFNHKNVPFESVVQKIKPERIIGSNPLFQVMFLYHQVPPTSSLEKEITWSYAPLDIGVSKFDLTLYISEEDQQLSATFEFATDILDEQATELMQGHLKRLVDGILQAPDSDIASLPLLTENEHSKIFQQWNRPAVPFNGSETITDLIQEIVRKFPDQPAIIFGDKTISYGDLDRKANVVVNRLISNNSYARGPVAVCAERSPEMVIGILAALKLGRTYVPMDSNYPASRLKHMIQDAGITQVLTPDHLMPMFESYQVCTISLNSNGTEVQMETPDLDPGEKSAIAYIIYTSGSTGRPKGVPVTHKNLLSSTLARMSYYPNHPKAFLLMSSFSFDSSVAGLFWTLGTGGALVIPEERLEQDIEALSRLIRKNNISHTLLLPSLYQLILQHAATENLNSLNTVILAGETCHAETCITHFDKLPGAKLYNEYGPTEATVWSTVHQVQPHDCTGTIPIGRPVDNVQVFILDENLSPVPAGVVGEIFIGGRGVVSGYLNQPDATNTAFVSSPSLADTVTRLYKTGDLGRYRLDGVIEFLGRKDQQLKIRGYRVEPGEIYRAIIDFPGIHECEILLKQYLASANPDKLDEDDIDKIVKVLSEMNTTQAEHLLLSVESTKHFDLQTADGEED